MNINQTQDKLSSLLRSKDERDIQLAFQLAEGNPLLQEAMEKVLWEYKTLYRDFFHVKKEKITSTDILELKSINNLNFNYQAFRSIPPEVKYLNHLLELNFFHNHLKALPPEIGDLKSLQYLGLVSNEITELPPEIGDMTALRDIYLNHNKLRTLPSEIQNLKNLNILDLRDNAISIAEEQKIRTWLPHCKLYF